MSRALLTTIALCAVSLAHAAAPTLYRQPAHQSPVRAQPDDLLLLPGYGFDAKDVAVYAAVSDADPAPPHPESAPSESTGDLGMAEVVSTANVPHSLTIKLPKAIRDGQPYALWVRTSRGEWSDAILINDARPLWLTPAYVYASVSIASLPRYVKVVGRNLQPAQGAATQIRLVGPRTIVVDAQPAQKDSEILDEFVAKADLPQLLAPGTYRVQVSRDAAHWVDLPDQSLEVRPDPPTAKEFPVSAAAYGGCRPDDAKNDLPCVVRAIAAARAAGGGTISFGAGEWTLSGSGVTSLDGIVVPRGVNLEGAGAGKTKVVRLADWNGPLPMATFSLAGHNDVQGFTFRDMRVYRPTDTPAPFLRLGMQRGESMEESGTIEQVSISRNVFDRANPAIADAGLPLRLIFVTDNEIGAYGVGLELGGNRFRVQQQFRIDDSVIAHNTFKPGSFLELKSRSGALASELGAGHRVDFSNNSADGTATEYLNSPQDARGWRAAFFWHMNGSHEMVLVSQNVATCTGDKVGDGEAIAYDNNANTWAFDSAAQVLAATSDSVTVAGPVLATQNNRNVSRDTYYTGHWIQVGEDRGVGQVRKIASYRADAASGRIAFKVSPQWDVTPQPGASRVNIGREYWQAYTLANTVDNRTPLCLKSNRSDRKAGVIGMWAQTADSVIAGNRQFDSDGILLQQLYSANDGSCDGCSRETYYVNAMDIRGNEIDGEYDVADDCSSSGILGSLAASATPRSPPPTVSYGLSISHNTIKGADAKGGGAIAFLPSWYQGPAPHRWPVANNVLIHHNDISGLHMSPARPCRANKPRARTGISLGSSSLIWRTVLYANSCADAPQSVLFGKQDDVRVCPPDAAASCECNR